MNTQLQWEQAEHSLSAIPNRANPKRPCPKCKGPRDRPGQRYCRRCHNTYQRDYKRRQAQELRDLRKLFHAKENVKRGTSRNQATEDRP